MPIQRNLAHSPSNRIDGPGDYVVTITAVNNVLTKISRKPMLVVEMETEDEKKIRDHFVLSLDFRMKALQSLKAAVGLGPEVKDPGALVGKQCGIAVAAKPPNDEGRIYMEIVGYGKSSDVEAHQHPPSSNTNHIPF